MKTYLFTFLTVALLIVSCSSDFQRRTIETENLSGFIESGNALGVYGDAGLKITQDSIQMTNWPISKLTESLKNVMDTAIATPGKMTDVYTIQIANKGQLEQREFVDSLIHVFSKNGLIN
ncbi:hypothetical protein AAU57_01985 [Nonlabens sp. YIK11]|uniref:hypothetical protein n=1 Tax=Nonlabens sp. YIK11 TaxID=1453349 RepID=UPI0006DD2D09|nr:hypothetical protein [Nonlabens sp. YIK11]KQC32229.1 hypothetical protein AAU57_01985 [Nonlabens sp. YIK11]